MCDFVHLHCHTEYSILDGYGSVNDMVSRAAELKQPGIAITDHGSMHGAIEFYRTCNEYGVKPIIGCELYITNFGVGMGHKENRARENHHLLLIAENDIGYKNLLKLSTIGWIDGFYYKPRIDYDVLRAHSDGLIATSGCMASAIPSAILNRAKEQEIDVIIDWYESVFKDRFYVELQHHPGIAGIEELNKSLIYYAKRHNLPMICTNDAHYARKEDADIHDTLLCVQTKSVKSVDKSKRFAFTDDEYYIKSRDEMDRYFSAYGLDESIYTNTLDILHRCNVDPDRESHIHHMPDVPGLSTSDYDNYLQELVEKNLDEKSGGRWRKSQKVKERVEYELKIIKETGFSRYYLIVNDILTYARDQNISWNIRGSGTGSYICYALGLSFVDPIKYGLIFERFLNSYRVTIPDLDIDFPDDKRNDIVRYLIDRYGEDRVAQVVTFARMKPRMAIRDVGRAYGLPQDRIDLIAKQVPNTPGKPITITKALTDGDEFYSHSLRVIYEEDQDANKVLNVSKNLEKTVRQTGVHAAAVIISDKPLVEYTALMRGGKTAITKHITQLDYPTLESIGLLKVDCLGLSTLTIIDECCKLVNSRHNKHYSATTIPFEDSKEAFDLLSSGETYAVFQVESRGLRNVLMSMRPETFQHVADAISLYRPGPIDYIDLYIRRKNGEESVQYLHDSLRKHLEKTQGIIIYQEQIIAILCDLAGYTPGEADVVRKGISKKNEEIIAENKEKFISGCFIHHGIEEDIAALIWDDIEKFAGYGFNLAHAASYARITLQTAYLKAKYPIEFMAACLMVEGHKYEKIAGYITECRRIGIDVLPPDINLSKYTFTITPGNNKAQNTSAYAGYPAYKKEVIRFGTSSIKNIGDSIAQEIAEMNGFTDIHSLLQLSSLKVNKRILDSLIFSGIFDSVYSNRKHLAHNADFILKQLESHRKNKTTKQLSMLGAKLRLLKGEAAVDLAQKEFEVLGTWVKEHPIKQYEFLLQSVRHSTLDVQEELAGEEITFIAVVADFRKSYTRKNEPMAFVTFSDLDGVCEAILYPRVYQELQVGQVVAVRGNVRIKNGEHVPILIVDRIGHNLSGAKSSKAITTHETPEKKDEQEIIWRVRVLKNAVDKVQERIIKADGRTLSIYVFDNDTPAGVLRYKDSGLLSDVLSIPGVLGR